MAPQSTNAPFLDGAETFGASYAIPQFLNAPFLDGGSGFGSSAFVGAAATALTVTNGATLLDESFARSWRDELSGTGVFSISLTNADADMPDFDDVLRFTIGESTVFAGVVESKDVVTFDPGEGAAEVTQIAGRGSLALLDSSLVEPARGLDAYPVEVTRSFSWVSPDFDTSPWPNSKQIRRTDVPTARAPYRYSPEWWPDKTSWWIWADRADVSELEAPLGRCLFRHDFVTADDYTLALFVGLDNFGSVFFDGARVADTENDASSYTIGRRIEIQVSAGAHVLAANVKNLGRGGGFNFTLWTVDEEGLLDTMIEHSDYNVKCLGYPTTPPGVTFGLAARILLELAQFRGELPDVTLDFDDFTDSGGNPWDTPAEITTEVGRSFLEFVEAATDWLADVEMAPGANVLRAWNWGTRGATPGVTIAATTNPLTSEVVALSHSGKHARVNRLVLRYKQGYTEATDATSITAYGQRTAFVDLGEVDSEATAQTIGEQLLDLRKDPQFAHMLTLSPVGSQPYDDFDLGDNVTHHIEDGTTASVRVRSINVQESDTGVLTYAIETNDLRMSDEERYDNWLKRQSMGSLVGGARVSSRSGEPLAPAVRISTTNVAEFSFDNVQLTASYSPKRPADSSGNLIELYATLTTAGSTSTTVRVYMDGVQVGTDLTFAAGAVVAEVDLEAAKCFRNINVFQTRIVTPGTDAAGLDVQVRAI